jgi:hypothetical protein
MSIINVFKVTSKTKTSLIMFFGTVAKNRKSDLFDSRILLKPIVKQYKQKRHSAYSNKRDIVSILIIMNKKLFIEYCEYHFISVIRNVLLRFKGITQVVV